MMFIFLVVWKFKGKPERFRISNTDIIKLANVKVDNPKFWDCIYQLTQSELLSMVEYKAKSYYKVNFNSSDDSEIVLTIDNFNNEVLQAEKPVLVDFWAPWCGPCKMVGPIVETLADENAGKLNVGKLNVDENSSLAAQFGVRSIPTLIFFKAGKEVKRIVGAQNKNQLQKAIDEVI